MGGLPKTIFDMLVLQVLKYYFWKVLVVSQIKLEGCLQYSHLDMN